MKLVYHVKFRANFGLFKATLGTVYGEVDLRDYLSPAALHALAAHISEDGDFVTLVNERGVYIALNLE
jgi:hypothetical protein